MRRNRFVIVGVLGGAQSLAWASTYYLPAVLGPAISTELELSAYVFYGIVSGALAISALLGPAVGALVDRYRGRFVLVGSLLPSIAGLITLALADGFVGLAAAWVLIGIGMGFGLFEAAVGTLAGIFRSSARRPIAAYSLVGALSSSLGWLVSSWSLQEFGWRLTCLHWGTALLFLAAPLYLFLPQPRRIRHHSAPSVAPKPTNQGTSVPIVWVGMAFCMGSLAISGLAAHLPRLLEINGASATMAIGLAATVGPAQVFARAVEVLALGRFSPVRLAWMAMLLHPLGGLLLFSGCALGPLAFPVLHGMGSGIFTTARATVPLVLFGPQGFGERFGHLSRRIRLVSACGPLLFALLIDHIGAPAVLVSSLLCLLAAVALFMVAMTSHQEQ